MTYQEAKDQANKLYTQVEVAGRALEVFPTGPLGLTPDAVKATQEYRAARAAYAAAFQTLQRWNRWYVKAYWQELAAERAAHRTRKVVP